MSDGRTFALVLAGAIVMMGVIMVFVVHFSPSGHVWHGIDEPVHCNVNRDKQTCISAHHRYTCVTTYDEHIDHWCTEGLTP